MHMYILRDKKYKCQFRSNQVEISNHGLLLFLVMYVLLGKTVMNHFHVEIT